MKNSIQKSMMIVIGFMLAKMCTPQKDVQPRTQHTQTTDTVYQTRYYTPPLSLTYQTIPSRFEVYKDKQSSKELIKTDSVFIIHDTLKVQDTVFIALDFVRLFPRNPKLINLSLSQDTLVLDLLNTEAQIYSLTYPIMLGEYQYNFDGNDLTHSENRNKPDRRHRLYTGVNYNIINHKPLVSLRYSKPMKSFNIHTFLTTSLENQPKMDILVGVEKKLF